LSVGLTIIGDCDRLAQLLSNLLNNAIKHTPGGVIEVALTRGGGQASLSVRDSGPGIPADQAELIFEPGRRVVNGEPHDSAGGTGLGLHIARGIVEAHGGRIWVENAEGEGATFWVALPTVVEVNTAAAQDIGGVRES
jgi:signal transduction histidine kinase